MKRCVTRFLAGLTILVLAGVSAHGQETAGRWTEMQANTWYDSQPWLVGANYVPSDAINQLEMFQKETFNPALNDKELGMAESIGMNTMRVFLQDQLWTSDPDGFKQRLNEFLTIAARPRLLLTRGSCSPAEDTGPRALRGRVVEVP